jgi:hypothetical protein
MGRPFALVFLNIMVLLQIVGLSVPSTQIALKTEHVAIKNVLILVKALVESMLCAKFSIIIQYAHVHLVKQEIHLCDVNRK